MDRLCLSADEKSASVKLWSDVLRFKCHGTPAADTRSDMLNKKNTRQNKVVVTDH